MAWRTSNGAVVNAIEAQGQAQFKATNNLLTLQENHVEEFFTYHGEMFLSALEQLMEDVIERVVSRTLKELKFQTSSSGEITIHNDAITALDTITAANIELDLHNLLASAINSEVIMQRKIAKSQYLESQGFQTQQIQAQATQATQSYPQSYQTTGVPNAGGLNPAEISGGNPMVQANNMVMQQQQAMNNPSGFPVQPNGYDTMGNPYWIDPVTGQPTYSPPGSGLGLGKMIQKGAAWAAWLA
tara:strand:- start:1590 stop:2318 length:729 start_codon:yes stop_codon:yes gene_type:complete